METMLERRQDATHIALIGQQVKTMDKRMDKIELAQKETNETVTDIRIEQAKQGEGINTLLLRSKKQGKNDFKVAAMWWSFVGMMTFSGGVLGAIVKAVITKGLSVKAAFLSLL